METAQKSLENTELPDIWFIVQLFGYNQEERGVDTLDGPFPVRSLAEAQQSIRAYRVEYDDNWTTQFWTMDLYDWDAKPLSDGVPIAVRTYILSSEENRSILYSGRKCRVSIPTMRELLAAII